MCLKLPTSQSRSQVRSLNSSKTVDFLYVLFSHHGRNLGICSVVHKFKTCIENQYLGQKFYRRENSKPLFNRNNIMNVRNLFINNCSNEIFKILKFRTSICMFEICTLSNRNGRETRLLTPYPSKSLFYVGSLLCNVVRDLIKINLCIFHKIRANQICHKGAHLQNPKAR